MTRTERMKLLVQAIGADIKAILAKTNLLKTAAYKDVGTTAGKIPEFIGNDGMGGFGYGASAKKLSVGSDLDLLPRVNAIYTGGKNDGILSRPPDLADYIFNHEFVVECVVGDGLSASYGAYIQRLSVDTFLPGTTNETNTVVFIRSRSYLGFSPWERITGKMYGIDVGGDVVGDDLVVNSIKAGATSPKIAFEIIRLDITYANFGYQSDGVTGIVGMNRGLTSIATSAPLLNILSMSSKLYGDYRGSPIPLPYEAGGSGKYVKMKAQSKGALYTIQTTAHLEEIGGDTSLNADNLFNNGSYIELFVTYKVD